LSFSARKLPQPPPSPPKQTNKKKTIDRWKAVKDEVTFNQNKHKSKNSSESGSGSGFLSGGASLGPAEQEQTSGVPGASMATSAPPSTTFTEWASNMFFPSSAVPASLAPNGTNHNNKNDDTSSHAPKKVKRKSAATKQADA